MREQAGLIQIEVRRMLEDVVRLGKRVDNLETHFGQATKDIREIQTSTGKIVGRAGKIEDIELGEDATDAVEAPGPRLTSV